LKRLGLKRKRKLEVVRLRSRAGLIGSGGCQGEIGAETLEVSCLRELDDLSSLGSLKGPLFPWVVRELSQ
jgi:hypothetical protein